mmetsp:Transcript_37315/g.46089  ORF Transcript_37315/g.46089 Transcript_37315/m.46089 type:complete len:253 (+) Transcript_37315:54-812(+)
MTNRKERKRALNGKNMDKIEEPKLKKRRIERKLILNKPKKIPKIKKIIKPKKKLKTLDSYEINVGYYRRCYWLCRYKFGINYEYNIEISKPIGKADEIKQCIAVLSQSLTNVRAKASLQTDKNCYLIILKKDENVVGCGIFHCDNILLRVNIEMFAIDINYRGHGLSSIMIYLLQSRMKYYNSHDLFVCAALDAVPFWLNIKYGFVITKPALLEQHEILSERKGHTKHLIWHGKNNPDTLLLNSFNKYHIRT